MLYVINEKVIQLEKEGKRIIKFNIGDPDQDTSASIIEASLKGMKAGRTKYGSSAGEKNLREKLAEMRGVKAENVIISPGSKWNIFAIMYLLLKGGNVIIPSPHWTSYDLIAKNIGAEARYLKTSLEDEWKIDVEKLKNLIDDKTKLIILNSPNNPTSKVVDEKTMKAIVDIASEKNIPILSDECYADISFVKTKSILDFGQENIYVNSFSKTYAMTGWRVGYAIMNKELVEKIVKLNQITITNVPMFIQDAALKALDMKDKISKEISDIYKKRADVVSKSLAKTKLKFSKPDAPFYFFPRCFADSEKLALSLLDKGVAITPGTAFGDYKEHFRLALTIPDKDIKEGIEKIKEAFK